jgi:hypothetical protein
MTEGLTLIGVHMSHLRCPGRFDSLTSAQDTLTILGASNPDLKDSDDNCQEFAAHYFERLHFLHKQAGGYDPEVSTL